MTAIELKQPNDADGPKVLRGAPLKILLADDHALFRAGLRHLLSHIGAQLEIEEAHDLEDTVRRLGTLKDLDLLLLDLNMPGMEGFAGVRRLCELAPDVPVIVVSVRDVVEFLVEAFPREVLNLPVEGKKSQKAREGA